MANTLLTHTMIAQRALFDLHNSLVMSRHVYKGYNTEFRARGRFKVGSSVTIALPNKYRTKDGATMDVVDTYERSTTVSVDTQKHVAFNITESDYMFKIEDFSRKHLVPATIALANKLDNDGMKEYVNVYNQVGTPGTTPSTFQVLADSAERMDNEAIPQDSRLRIFSPKAYWSMAAGELKGVFNENIVDTMLRRGFVGRFANADHFMSQNVPAHTVGAHGGTPLMNGATAEGATSIVTNGWSATTAILKAGDIITIDGVYAVNPISGDKWEGNQLRQFVVTANTSSVASDATIPIYPTIYSASATEKVLPYQTVDALPANDAAITVVGTASTAYPMNLCFHPNAFALTVLPFQAPKSANKSVMWGQASDQDLGLSITVATGFDIANYDEDTRMDILYGWDTIEPNYAVRIIG